MQEERWIFNLNPRGYLEAAVRIAALCIDGALRQE